MKGPSSWWTTANSSATSPYHGETAGPGPEGYRRRGLREEVRHQGNSDPHRTIRHDGPAYRQLPKLHAHARETAPGRGNRRQGRGRHQSGGPVLPRRQGHVLGREALEGIG